MYHKWCDMKMDKKELNKIKKGWQNGRMPELRSG